MAYFNTCLNAAETVPCYLSVLFIDAHVKDVAQLLASVRPGIETHVLLPHHDGVAQITNILLSQYRHRSIDAIHIVSGGVPGCVKFATGELSLSTLTLQAIDLAVWEAPVLHLYGCNVAAGDAGEELLLKLYQITGAEVHASKTKVGHADWGGNWELESTFPQRSSFSADLGSSWIFSAETLANYAGVLDGAISSR